MCVNFQGYTVLFPFSYIIRDYALLLINKQLERTFQNSLSKIQPTLDREIISLHQKVHISLLVKLQSVIVKC
jgi:hypothetical protein